MQKSGDECLAEGIVCTETLGRGVIGMSRELQVTSGAKAGMSKAWGFPRGIRATGGLVQRGTCFMCGAEEEEHTVQLKLALDPCVKALASALPWLLQCPYPHSQEGDL